MRYLDLDNIPSRPPAPLRAQRGGSKIGRWAKFLSILAVTSGLIYAGYSLFWPASATLADIFKAPAAVLSFIRSSDQDLKQTNGRTNFLLVGIDKRSYEQYASNDCFRSDTMVVASVDMAAKNKDVVLVSVPRDLWVTLPSWGTGRDKFGPQGAKINAAYCYGDQYNYPQGRGLGLARDTVQQVLGLPIHYAIRVDFEGFKKMLNSVGGVSVNVEAAFTDCEYPIEGQEDNPIESRRYECISFKKGYQYMDSSTALKFVRSRHGTGGEGSDLARAHRQQKIMVAVRDKALSAQTLADPLKVSSLIKSFDQTIQTLDVDFGQIGQFYKLVQSINADSAQNIVLSNDPSDEAGLLTVPPADNYGGAFVFVPRTGEGNYLEIQRFIARKLAEAGLAKEASPAAQPARR